MSSFSAEISCPLSLTFFYKLFIIKIIPVDMNTPSALVFREIKSILDHKPQKKLSYSCTSDPKVDVISWLLMGGGGGGGDTFQSLFLR